MARHKKLKFTEEIGLHILTGMIQGKSLVSILNAQGVEGLPKSRDVVYGWLSEHRDFGDNYVRARMLQADSIVDDIVDSFGEEFDDPIQAAAAKIDFEKKKWFVGRMRPNLYGEPTLVREHARRIDEKELLQDTEAVTIDHDDDVPKDPKQVARILNWVMTRNQQKLLEKE